MEEKIIAEIRNIKRCNTNPLEKFLTTGSDFFTAPASNQYHLAEKGGLALHSWNVFEALKPIAKKYVPTATEETIIICGLLHDLCKANFYKLSSRNVKRDGKWVSVPYYDFDDKDPLGHGEKSVIILQRYMPVTEDEALAIRHHMGVWEAEGYGARKALNAAIDKCPMLRALMLADQFATFFIESNDAKTK